MYELTRKELARGRNMVIGAALAPAALAILPAAVTLLLMLLVAAGPPMAAVIFFFGAVATALAFIAGLVVSGVLVRRRSRWSKEIRELMAAEGIRAEDLSWFYKELKPSEKRALRAVEGRDLLLGDAYRETLASRLTATRVIRSSRRELTLAKRRKNAIQRLKSANSDSFETEVRGDIEKLENINSEARALLEEAEARLQMIEASAARQGALATSELALKKLSARAAELPLALQSAKMADEIRAELEKEDDEDRNEELVK